MIIPPHAQVLFPHLDFTKAKLLKKKFIGLTGSAIALFPDCLIFTSGANIDADGPGGSKQADPDWQSETSLRYSDGTSCDSRHFPGVVVPPYLMQNGVKIGDFAYIIWRNDMVPCQVYDQGPKDKLGEISLFAGRASGVVLPSINDHIAATKGNSVTDLTTVIYKGSGPRHAIAPDLIALAAAQCRAKSA